MLYPPILASSMPAFDYKQSVRIYFAISTYNSLGDIAQAQLTVRFQKNNRNAMDTTKYPNKIKCCPITEVTPRQDETIASMAARYYVELQPGDLVEGKFDPTLLYKVQIRFSTRSWSSQSSAANLSSTASEWSTVCLLKPIEIPNFYILELGGAVTMDQQLGEDVAVVYSSIEPVFTGVYVPVDERESLKNWRMRLYNQFKTQLYADSGIQQANPYEADNGRFSFQCQMQYVMSNNTLYHLVFDIETRNGYTQTRDYAFTAMSFSTGTINASLNLSINEEDGYARVKLTGDGQIVHTNVTIRRTSSKSNFIVWEDIANKTFENSSLDWQFDDFTIESGVFYQYAAQTRDNRGRRSASIKSDKQMGEFEDAFLTEKGGSLDDAFQLKIRFNMAISNSIINVGEAKTDTIGSKYPFIRRNGNMYYHSFPISFLIAAQTDNSHLFATEKELRDNQTDLYRQAYGTNSLTVESGRYDYTYQREFRRKVETFLYNNQVKLFRSGTEGNMLIKLMDISLTPNQDLSRMLYSVDATAYEIDEPTLKNIDKYGIQHIGTYNPNIVFNEVKVGQLNRFRREWADNDNLATIEDYYPANFNLMGDTGEQGTIPTIKSTFHWGQSIDNIIVADLYLSYLRIEIDSPPYLIKNLNGTLVPLDDVEPTEDVVNAETLLGTLVNICGTTILIEYPNRIYEMKGSNVHIGSSQNITPLKDTQMVVDFVANLSKQNDNSVIATTLIYKSVVGQLVDTFPSEQSLCTRIKRKYYLDLYQSKNVEQPYYLRVQVIYNLNIEADPGTVLYVSSNANTEVQRLVVDESGILFIDPGIDSGYITQAYFYGRNIEKRWTKDRGAAQPSDPSQLDRYTDKTGTHIFYNGDWYLGTEQDNGASYDIPIEVPAIVEYYIQTERGIY